ncbi:MAG: PPOX class F420-dependent oxidoreductase [Anaerolineales bacterium]|nr:PPOX class F420-dependent oxidoreductase [Anaerolineales bacterium]
MSVIISPEAQAFLARPLLGRLATASPDGQPHVVPVWFLWEDGCVWVSSFQSTRKVIDLQNNPQCAIVVDIEQGQEPLSAVVIEGHAELIRAPFSEVRQRAQRIYAKYLGAEGVLAAEPQSWLDSPENLLIKITPKRVKTW